MKHSPWIFQFVTGSTTNLDPLKYVFKFEGKDVWVYCIYLFIHSLSLNLTRILLGLVSWQSSWTKGKSPTLAINQSWIDLEANSMACLASVIRGNLKHRKTSRKSIHPSFSPRDLEKERLNANFVRILDPSPPKVKQTRSSFDCHFPPI